VDAKGRVTVTGPVTAVTTPASCGGAAAADGVPGPSVSQLTTGIRSTKRHVARSPNSASSQTDVQGPCRGMLEARLLTTSRIYW